MKIDNCAPAKNYGKDRFEFVIRAWRKLLPRNIILYNSRFGCRAATSCRNIAGRPLSVVFHKNNKVKP